MIYLYDELRDDYGVEFTEEQSKEVTTLRTGLEDHMKIYESIKIESPSKIIVHLSSEELGKKNFEQFVDDTIYMVERLNYFELVEDKEIRNKFGEWRAEYIIAFTGEK